MVSAVYRPPLVIVPPCTFQLAATATLSPAWVRPYVRNCRDWYGSSVTVSGETTICTTGLLGWLGPVTCTGRSHATASMPAARASDAFISARRLDSLNVNGRSEEHTSELQSRLHLVCRLLLEKKKKKQNT